MEGGAVTEEEVEEFLNALRAADVDKKVNLIQLWGLKLEQVSELPARAIDGITLSVGPLVRSPSQLLATSTLSGFLPFYIPLLPISPQAHLNLAILHLLPALVEKLNDPKEKVHVPARNGVRSLGVKVYQSAASQPSTDGHLGKGKDKDNLPLQWETAVRDALGGRGTRCKLEGLKLLVQLRADEVIKLPLKPWLPALVNLLEDSDGTVRDHAREAVVTLLSPANTPPAARSELKKLMIARSVRKSISDGIIARVMGGVNGTTTATARPLGVHGSASETSQIDDDVEIVYIAGARDLESEFRAMGPHFIGKETEHNWVHREQSIMRVRGMLRGGVFETVPEAFLQGLKVVVIDGVCKTLLSLRTTLAQQSCILVQELADHLGPSLDPFGDQLLTVLGKMAGFTKRLIAERSQNAVTAIIKRTALNSRVVISHIQTAINDKSVQARQYGVAHLRVFLATPAGQAIGAHDSTPSVNEMVDQILRRALADTNAQVREQARSTFWTFEAIDQRTAAAISAGLDGPARKQLEKVNPQQSKERIPPSTARSSLKSKTANSMSAMIAAKRAKAAAERAGTATDSTRLVSPKAVELPPSNSVVAEDRGFMVQDGSPRPSHAFISPSPPQGNTREYAPRSSKLSGQDASKNDTSFSDGMSSTSARSKESKSGSPSEVLSRSHDSPQYAEFKSGPETHPKHRMCSEPRQHHLPIAPRTFCERASTSGLKSPSSSDFVDPAEDARRAQAAQGLSAAKQLLEFDDDEVTIPTVPITPLRKCIPHLQATSKTPLNRMSAQPEWKDSPMPMTPKLIHTLESSGHERSWWNTRRKLLAESTISPSDGQLSGIESDLNALNPPNPAVLQRIARFSACNVVKRNDSGIESSIWDHENLFDRVLSGVLALLDQQQEPAVLEHALVAVWELLQNQWPLFDLREEVLLDHLFQLRTSSNAVVVESTNAMFSLLAALCDPPFFLLLLCSALDRFLTAHPEMTHRTAGYNLALNTMGMCILRLPQEAVELEAGRVSHHVVQSLDHELGVASRQAGNRVIMAVQCMLQDDNRTLAAFPQLSASQRDFVTYQMEQAGLLRSDHESSIGVEAMHHDLVDGLAKGSRTR